MFSKVEYGFWKQDNPEIFNYTEKYKSSQSTNLEISCLRFGWLSSFFSYDELNNMNVVDVGCGNGVFVDFCKNKFSNISSYDIIGESISYSELINTQWDMIILTDVLEHFPDINNLFNMKWKYAFISFPETPNVNTIDELKKWRHYKPNEHVWCLNLKGVIEWLKYNNCNVIGSTNVEDFIRKRWDNNFPNISSILVEK